MTDLNRECCTCKSVPLTMSEGAASWYPLQTEVGSKCRLLHSCGLVLCLSVGVNADPRQADIETQSIRVVCAPSCPHVTWQKSCVFRSPPHKQFLFPPLPLTNLT